MPLPSDFNLNVSPNFVQFNSTYIIHIKITTTPLCQQCELQAQWAGHRGGPGQAPDGMDSRHLQVTQYRWISQSYLPAPAQLVLSNILINLSVKPFSIYVCTTGSR